MVEIKNLKDMLRNAAGSPVGIQMCQEAADTLEQLQAENDRLKGERDAAEEIPKVWKTCDRFNGWQWLGPKED